jgi:hypothetical protein
MSCRSWTFLLLLILFFLYSLLWMIFSHQALWNNAEGGLNSSMISAFSFPDTFFHKKVIYLLQSVGHDLDQSEKNHADTSNQSIINIPGLNESTTFDNSSSEADVLSTSAETDGTDIYIHSGRSSTTSPRRANEVFYFAVTHHSTINSRLDACLRTWCSRVLAFTGNKVIWYSNRPDPRIDHVISVDYDDPYSNITWRMMAIWKHVAKNYPDYLWYARFWDDNIVFPETFELLLTGQNSDEPIEIGRLAMFPSGQLVKSGEEAAAASLSKLYIDGGAGSLMSRAAFHLLTTNMDQCESWLQEVVSEYSCAFACEDVLFGACESSLLGIRFKRGLGMYHTTPPALHVSDPEMIQHDVVDGEHSGDWSVLRTLHAADHQAMDRIDRLWYN